MSHRRPDPRQATLEQTLRRALRLAADSIEPAGDGLERIRTKIAAAPPAQSVHRTWLASWGSRYLTGLLAALSVAARHLGPIAVRIRYACVGFAEQFSGPDDTSGRWGGWMRPVAAMATGLLVVLGVSWAFTALPAYTSNVSDTGVPGGSSSSSSSSSHHSHRGSPQGGVTGGQSGSTTPTTSASCEPGNGPGTSSASSPTSPSTTPTGSPSTSPSPSPSPSPSSSSTDTSTPSPTDTPTSTPTPGTSEQAMPGTQSAPDPPGSPTASAAAAPKPQPQISNPRTVQSTSPSPSASGCG